ncbi:MAG: hydantoinase/oxoprolinase family protein [Emergencia sp.]|nr:hydantoinase/oxoprolinase family protein [Emergencia sp.]
MIGIGIDTGGTCTDAVVLNTDGNQVLSFSKTLTTKGDLKEGILKALRGLDENLVKQAEYLSLSTTLATNACVEGKGGRAKLVLIGVKPQMIARMQGTYGLPPVSEICFLEGDAATVDKGTPLPDWETFRETVKETFREFDSVAIVQMNAKYNDGQFEKEAEAIIGEVLSVPCVRGYNLYQELNVQKRAATALLNARLIPVMENFFDSIDQSLAELGLSLPIQVVKSDGNIMSRDYAMGRPVETLLCGPAASIIGAMELSDKKDALIVDMGGTTSDVALLKNRVPVTSDAGISIGPWKTMVKGVTIDTFALGGDSAVEYEDNSIYLEKRRIVPLSMAAAQFPRIREKLTELNAGFATYSYPANQFFMLVNRPKNMARYTANEQKLIEALAVQPLMFSEAAEAVGVSPYVFRSKRLEDEGVIIRCGVTPTDVMHICGDYDAYDVEAAKQGVIYLCNATKKDFDTVCREIYDLAKARLYSSLTGIFMKYETDGKLSAEDEAAVEKLAAYIFKQRQSGAKFMRPDFKSQIDFIGIGAPTRIFLPEVAALFGASADVPEYAKVANAIGAAVGRVVAEYTVHIQPALGVYRVTGGSKTMTFEEYDEALSAAKKVAEERAGEKALEQGAAKVTRVETEVSEDYYQLTGESRKLFLETLVTAKAVTK